MLLRKRTDGRVLKEEFVDLGEMRKLLVAGDPSDSDPGYEVPQVLGTNVIHYSVQLHIYDFRDILTC